MTWLTQGLEANLYRLNPWWRGLPQAPLPPVKRWAFSLALGRLKNGLTKATVVSGPRQAGAAFFAPRSWRFGARGRIPPYLPFNGLAPLKDKDFWLGLRQFGLEHQALRDRAFTAFSERGAYPIAHVRADRPWDELADLLNETVIRRAIRHDLRVGPRGTRRDEHLLNAKKT